MKNNPVLSAARNVESPPDSRLRVALYSHDTMGLGHFRRNLLIAQALASSELRPQILMIAGAPEVLAYRLPPGVDCLTIPALRKDTAGRYRARRLDLGIWDLVALRARTIRSALIEYFPDVLVVDKVPRGALNELDLSLRYLRETGRTKCILGLRDVLDAPDVTRHEWVASASEAAIREYYDAIWVYGDPAVYDPVKEYEFSSEIAAKVCYTGYHDQRNRLNLLNTEELAGYPSLPRPYVLCSVGGGQDGTVLAEAFAHIDFPSSTHGVLITGPYMPPETQRYLNVCAEKNPRLTVIPFVNEPVCLLRNAERLIAMGGYNTVCEVLSFGKPALIVPRVTPRQEQLIRAERLREMGIVDMLSLDDVTPGALLRWLSQDAKRPVVKGRVDLEGLVRVPRLLSHVLNSSQDDRRIGASVDLVTHEM